MKISIKSTRKTHINKQCQTILFFFFVIFFLVDCRKLKENQINKKLLIQKQQKKTTWILKIGQMVMDLLEIVSIY